MFEAESWGDAVPCAVVWEAIESVAGSQAKMRTAAEAVKEYIPPADAAPNGEWRAQVVERFKMVRGFVRMLCQVIDFGATAEAVRVVKAMRALPKLLDADETGPGAQWATRTPGRSTSGWCSRAGGTS